MFPLAKIVNGAIRIRREGRRNESLSKRNCENASATRVAGNTKRHIVKKFEENAKSDSNTDTKNLKSKIKKY